ncbi:hypothetical protein BX070DRAFT_236621 [Coemansia spiralis]|nr:hypothetical protein BX070DRAFT_236621 [Coemansia spiralis]
MKNLVHRKENCCQAIGGNSVCFQTTRGSSACCRDTPKLESQNLELYEYSQDSDSSYEPVEPDDPFAEVVKPAVFVDPFVELVDPFAKQVFPMQMRYPKIC